jgi:long-chain fatty acid omega-monooxygenase
MLVTLFYLLATMSIVVVVGAAFLFFESRKRYNLVKHIPGPAPNAFLGNVVDQLGMDDEQRIMYFMNCALKYGAFRVSAPLKPPAVFVVDPRDVKYILVDNFENYPKGQEISAIFRVLAGDGIFNSDGELWRAQRKTMSHVFKIRSLRSMLNVFVDHGRKLVRLLDDVAARDGVVDLQDLMFRFTFDTATKFAFGYELRSLENGVSDFSRAFDRVQSLVERRSRNPFWRLAPISAEDRGAVAKLDELTALIIARRRAEMAEQQSNGEAGDDDLLALYIKHFPGCTDQYLRDMILNTALASRDTMASTLSYAFYYLAKNEDVNERMIDELNRNVADLSNPQYEELLPRSIGYTRAVLRETLRLAPPVMFDPKENIADDVLPSGLRIPKGTTVVWSAFISGRIPEFWIGTGYPIDQFAPERHMDGGKSLPHPILRDLPFQAGPRICLGMSMARLEMSTVLAMLAPRYRFTLQRDKIVMRKAITLAAESVLVKVGRR